MTIQLKDIQKKIYELGEKINAPSSFLIIHDGPISDGTPYVEIESDTSFHYVSNERGHEFSRKSTTSLDELLYWIMDGVITAMSLQYELENRIEGQDPRRILFSKEIELFNKLKPEWEDRIKKEIALILEKSPYRDGFFYTENNISKILLLKIKSFFKRY